MHRWLVIPVLVAATTTALPAGATPGVDAQVRAVMAQMSLTDKVEQMFVSYVYGTSATVTDASDVTNNQALYGTSVTDGADLLAQYHLGGLIYFSWANGLTDPQAIGALSNGLQQAAMAGTNPIPLQISTDQEGGIVNRIGAPVAVSPGNLAIGATFNPADAYRAASVSGAELRAMGINMDDAPVVDVNTNPRNAADGPRSFGDRPAMVSGLAAAAVLGYQHAGVAAQAKHFPGTRRRQNAELQGQCGRGFPLAELTDKCGNRVIGHRSMMPPRQLERFRQQMVQVPAPPSWIFATAVAFGLRGVQNLFDPSAQARGGLRLFRPNWL